MLFGLILAGGSGTRMGGDVPKQFMKIGGKCVVSHTVEHFLNIDEFKKIILLTPENWVSKTKDILQNEISDNERVVVINGDKQRNDTLIKGIDYIDREFGLNEDTLVVTHDAVRPFVTESIINDNIIGLKKYTACGTVILATDTIVYSNNGEYINDVPERRFLFQEQTPQSFRASTFKRYYSAMSEKQRAEFTDALAIFVVNGEKVGLIQGDYSNIKITYPFDIKIANAILEENNAL